jgi:hypothetical protein
MSLLAFPANINKARNGKNVNFAIHLKNKPNRRIMASITFQVDLSLPLSEAVGPLTNQSMQGTLHPDKFVNPEHQTLAATLLANRPSTRSVWIQTGAGVPSQLGATIGRRGLLHGDTFTLTGTQALYVRDMYAVGYAPYDRAVLTIVP